jgi:hypothetical protein
MSARGAVDKGQAGIKPIDLCNQFLVLIFILILILIFFRNPMQKED